MKKIRKIIVAVLMTMTLTTSVTVLAATYGDYYNGVRNTEIFQVQYFGEAWTTRRGHTTWIKYYRSGRYVGGAIAMKDSWRPASDRVYSSVNIWDSFNPWAPKTQFYYKL